MVQTRVVIGNEEKINDYTDGVPPSTCGRSLLITRHTGLLVGGNVSPYSRSLTSLKQIGEGLQVVANSFINADRLPMSLSQLIPYYHKQ